MERNSIFEKVEKYVLKNINMDQIGNDVNIFEDGLVSSLFAIELMTFLEKNFDIKITTDDLDMENYRSINNIVEFICKKNADNT